MAWRSALRLLAALICLCVGLLLWRNIILHFAQIEEILPGLRVSDLLRGKGLFMILIGAALLVAIWLATQLPWQSILSPRRHLRLALAIAFFLPAFIPLFWLRFGAVAWLMLLLLVASFFLNTMGLLTLCINLAPRFRLPTLPPHAFWNRLQPWFPAFLLLVASVYFSARCFGHLPHVEDSIAQLLQARIFGSGQITTEAFQPREFFFFSFMVDSNRWFSQYPPGHPLLLTFGVLTGIPHLINPLLGFLSVLLFYRLLKELEGHSFAAWGAWALALSPLVIFMSSEFMNHSTALMASLLGWLALKKGAEGKQGWLILAGLSFGYCALTRALDGAVCAAAGGLFLLSNFGYRQVQGWVKCIPYTSMIVLMALAYVIYNAMTTGHPFVTGYSLTWGGSGFGLGPVNWGEPHTLSYGLINTFMAIGGLNVYLWEIPLPALAAVFLWGILGDRLSRWDRAFLTVTLLILIGHLFYYFYDFSFGVRYYYILVPVLIYFSLKGLRALYLRLLGPMNIPPLTVQRGFVIAGIFLLLLQLLIALPYRASVYADSYWGTDDGPMREARRQDLHKAIVFIENHPWEILMTKLHALGFIMGDAHRFLFLITQEGLDDVLSDLGIRGEALWQAKPDLHDLEQRIYAWNREYLSSGQLPIDPWTESGYYTYFSNGALHLDPSNRNPDIILTRDLGDHNRVLMQTHPERKAYRFAWDEEARRFQIRPLHIPGE